MQVLVVINPFGGHAKGDRIADRGEIASILDGEHARDVVLADHPDVHHSEAPDSEGPDDGVADDGVAGDETHDHTEE